MREQTFRSPGFFEREIDLTTRDTVIEGVPAGVIGTAKTGPEKATSEDPTEAAKQWRRQHKAADSPHPPLGDQATAHPPAPDKGAQPLIGSTWLP